MRNQKAERLNARPILLFAVQIDFYAEKIDKKFYIFGKTRHSRMTESKKNHNLIKTSVFMLF